MPFRAVALLAAAIALCGCTDADWDHLTRFSRSDAVSPTPVAAAPMREAPVATAQAADPAAPAQNNFCRAVAEQDATGNDFDTATQARVLVQSYRQCVAIYPADPAP